MSWENIITEITNAHQDAITVFETLTDLLISDNDITVTLSNGTTYTLESYKNMKKGLIDSLSVGDYTFIMAQNNKTTLSNMGLVFFVDSDLGNDSTGTGSYDSPYKTVSKAIRSINGKFGVVFLKIGNTYALSRELANGSDDIYVTDKFVVIDAYNHVDNVVFELGTNITGITTDTVKPILYPKTTVSTSDSTKSATIDSQIIDIFKMKYTGNSATSLYSSTNLSSVFSSEVTTAKTRPYFYSFVLNNSVLMLNNVVLTNDLSGNIGSYPTLNPFRNAYANGTGTDGFRFRPMPAVFKDFHFRRQIDEVTNTITTVNDVITSTPYFGKAENTVYMRNCSFYIYGTNGSLFYFNNMLDTSDQYKIIVQNSTMQKATSDTSTDGVFHRYNPLILLENHRVDNSVSFPLNVYNSQTTLYKTEMFNMKYSIDLLTDGLLVNSILTKGKVGDATPPTGNNNFDSYGFFGAITPTTDYVLPYSFNLFRLIETYKYEFGASDSSSLTFTTTIFSDYYHQLRKYSDYQTDNEYGLYTKYNGGTQKPVNPNVMRLLYVPATQMNVTLSSGVPAPSFIVSSNGKPILVRSPIITMKRITSNTESIALNQELS